MSMAERHPFPYDPFQQRAIEAIERGASVFVAAPTGAGKTVLADYVIERALDQGLRVIYTAPIKALSNQKFRDFCARHPERVGILTGDVTINPRAPLLIMTTEIYRNTLLEEQTRLREYAWIIFDEIHFLDDPERGTVWEEALLFTPAHISVLALSATIPNVRELAGWIGGIHDRPVEIIEESRRPVPLHTFFQCQNTIVSDAQQLKPLLDAPPAGPRHAHHRRFQQRLGFHPNRLSRLVEHLRREDRLPAILFTFGRRRAEDLAWEASGMGLASEEESRELLAMYDGLCRQFEVAHEPSAQLLRRLIERGAAYHHAGMLPTMKEVIERCFVSRRVKLIITTETFALGINMPARTVVLDALKKRQGHGFQLLRRREFLQMAGRAGRRGMDATGYVYLRLSPGHVSAAEVHQVLTGPPEPVVSRFNSAYATLLNLYRRHRWALLDIFPKTFYAHQTQGVRREAGLDLMRRKLKVLETLGYITPKGLSGKGEFASWLYGYELLLGELHARGQLRDLDPLALALLLLAIAHEPRPNAEPPKSHRLTRRLAERCHEPLAAIHRAERQFTIRPFTKAPAFALSRALEAWMGKAPFAHLMRLTEADEGELVRYFRMTVQLLRQLQEAPGAEPALQQVAARAIQRINRDVVDAEAQLRLG